MVMGAKLPMGLWFLVLLTDSMEDVLSALEDPGVLGGDSDWGLPPPSLQTCYSLGSARPPPPHPH